MNLISLCELVFINLKEKLIYCLEKKINLTLKQEGRKIPIRNFKSINITQSSFYYRQKHFDLPKKYKDVKELIKVIY